jgi:hypothetical protein
VFYYFVIRPTKNPDRMAAALRFAGVTNAPEAFAEMAGAMVEALDARNFTQLFIDTFDRALFKRGGLRLTPAETYHVASDMIDSSWKGFVEQFGYDSFDDRGYWHDDYHFR